MDGMAGGHRRAAWLLTQRSGRPSVTGTHNPSTRRAEGQEMDRRQPAPKNAVQAAGSRGAEPCELCGEATATGTALYSDRRVLDGKDGRSYVCALCVQRVNAVRHAAPLTDEELQQAINTAGITGQAFGASAH